MFRGKRIVPFPSMRDERGVVLVVALIFLVLLTVLAISASGRSLLQERMAGNVRDAQLARMSAESALRGAEWRLWKYSADAGLHMQCGMGVLADCFVHDPAQPNDQVIAFRTSAGWLAEAGTEYKGSDGSLDFTRAEDATAVLAHNPRYLIEDLGEGRPSGEGAQEEYDPAVPRNHIYRITARATGANANTLSVLESTFSARGGDGAAAEPGSGDARWRRRSWRVLDVGE
ncbi:pilus assembly PilX family protein [Dyella subtropica]|uniref:pilus assembly PilX family protein n=1 Tax=Dyella subtropica TaxID=2992127 RepID=UPI00225C2E15|nr:PilX N-terminal domain-containing pilus assembly protein [Dyella subtropica]